MSLRSKMGRRHEERLAELFGTSRAPGSGNQWRNQMDGRNNRLSKLFAFAWDGKSTLAKSISIPRTMWEKAREQAGGERPMLALRFYDNEKLDVGEDLAVIGLDDFVEMWEAANAAPPPPSDKPTLVFVTSVPPPDHEFLFHGPQVRVAPRTPIIVVRDGVASMAQHVEIRTGLSEITRIWIDDKEEKGVVMVYQDNVPVYSNAAGRLTT